jgi:hypothetical protein
MKIISSVGNKVTLEHVRKNGTAMKVEIDVDNDSRRFVKSNIDKIVYDVTNNILKVVADGSTTTLAKAFANSKHSDLPENRNIRFKDGNKFNFKSKNLFIVE